MLLVRRRRPRPCIGGDVVQKCGAPAGRAQARKPGGRLVRRGGVGRASGGRAPGVRLLGRAYIYMVLKPCSRAWAHPRQVLDALVADKALGARLAAPSVSYGAANLFMRGPLEEATRGNLARVRGPAAPRPTARPRAGRAAH